jgi:hypothetical protein
MTTRLPGRVDGAEAKALGSVAAPPGGGAADVVAFGAQPARTLRPTSATRSLARAAITASRVVRMGSCGLLNLVQRLEQGVFGGRTIGVAEVLDVRRPVDRPREADLGAFGLLDVHPGGAERTERVARGHGGG